mmetsp:Transcript_12478/g.27824  ORF Transcript_12478/g.27824 Transcript_12478/m.27824 type:complete len:240 (-) Transcript_12478:694-1413(-)
MASIKSRSSSSAEEGAPRFPAPDFFFGAFFAVTARNAANSGSSYSQSAPLAGLAAAAFANALVGFAGFVGIGQAAALPSAGPAAACGAERDTRSPPELELAACPTAAPDVSAPDASARLPASAQFCSPPSCCHAGSQPPSPSSWPQSSSSYPLSSPPWPGSAKDPHPSCSGPGSGSPHAPLGAAGVGAGAARGAVVDGLQKSGSASRCTGGELLLGACCPRRGAGAGVRAGTKVPHADT